MSAPEQPAAPGTDAEAAEQPASPSHRRIIEQDRARQAWDDVREAKTRFGLKKDEQGRYRSRALELNAMMQINGLGQALAFLKAKGEVDERQPRRLDDPDALLFWHLSDWVGERMKAGPEGLLHWITHEASINDYRRATVECMAFGVWLRRFAEAELKTPNNAAGKRGSQ